MYPKTVTEESVQGLQRMQEFASSTSEAVQDAVAVEIEVMLSRALAELEKVG